MAEIPKTCEECRLKQATVTLYGYMLIYCNAAGFPIEDLEIRHNVCPLIDLSKYEDALKQIRMKNDVGNDQ